MTDEYERQMPIPRRLKERDNTILDPLGDE